VCAQSVTTNGDCRKLAEDASGKSIVSALRRRFSTATTAKPTAKPAATASAPAGSLSDAATTGAFSAGAAGFRLGRKRDRISVETGVNAHLVKYVVDELLDRLIIYAGIDRLIEDNAEFRFVVLEFQMLKLPRPHD